MVKSSADDMQRGVWDKADEKKMHTYASKQHATGNWATFSKRSGQRKSGKLNREKWINDQKPDPRQKSFTPQEEELVIQLHAAIGSRWPIIAQQLPGRTDNDVKILWNSKLRKKLAAMGIDPITHKPFSQILADYGNIGAFPKARTRFSSLSRDLKNAIILKSEQSQMHIPQVFSNSAKTEPSDHLYSQLQAVNMITEASNFVTLCASSSSEFPSSTVNQEISSFSWSDFLLEDAFLATDVDREEQKAIRVQGGNENIDGKQNSGAVEEDKNSGVVVVNSFEASSSSNSSSFVEQMLEIQDEMFSELSGFCDEPFYY